MEETVIVQSNKQFNIRILNVSMFAHRSEAITFVLTVRLWNESVKSFAAIMASLFLNLKKATLESVACWFVVSWNTVGCLFYNYHLKN